MGMEDDTRNFLILIMQTVSSIILWLMVNIFFGLYLQYGMFTTSPNFVNMMYYCIFIAGSIALFLFFKKKWKALKIP